MKDKILIIASTMGIFLILLVAFSAGLTQGVAFMVVAYDMHINFLTVILLSILLSFIITSGIVYFINGKSE